MFKRYPDPHHYLFAIPIGRKKLRRLWNPSEDDIDPPVLCRKHLIFTYLYDSIPAQCGCRIFEIRFRIGTHYL
jgi:hypothetical protein